MKQILLTGASGYIAPYLIEEFTKRSDCKVTALYNSHPINIPEVEALQCDLSDFDILQKIFDRAKPDIVYHLASVTPTRIKDRDESYIEFFNSNVTRRIAELCNSHSSLLLYTSTDLVYENGSNIEEDFSPLEPLNLYAKTKLLGEDAVRENAQKYLILRLALVYGFSRSSYTSFFDECYRSLKAGKEVRAFYDQFRNPLYTEDAAEILAALPEKIKTSDTINLCGSETISRYMMCAELAKTFALNSELIKPVSCEEFTAYHMVKNLSLSNRKLQEYGFRPMTYIENLHRSKKYRP
jgi:dTDP-4-dehydrorhamnose reductase